MFVIIYALLGSVQELQRLQIYYNVGHFSDKTLFLHTFSTSKIA